MRKRAKGGAGASERLVVEGSIDADETIEFQGGTLEAVAAPGHSPAQACLYRPDQRVLFSTDAILPRITPKIGTHWYHRDDPLGDCFETLSVLEGLEVDTGSRHARALAWEAFPRRLRVDRQYASSS